MKSKIIAAAGISTLLMAGGVLSASASTSGYDIFKTAVKKTHNVNSFTAHVQASLENNGKVVYKVDSVNAENLKEEAGHSAVQITKGGKTTNVDFYSNQNGTILKSSTDKKYYVRQEKDHKHEHKNEKDEKLSPQMQKDIENIFDALTKNYQDKITTSDLGNGKTELQFDLSKEQVPAVAQAVVSFYLKNMNHHENHKEKQEFASLKFGDLAPKLPKLGKNISVTRVVLKGEVNKNQYLTGQEATIYVSGDEVNGTHNDLVLTITSQLSQLNQAKVPTINLKGKKVVQIKEHHDGHED
jgi:guanyl-specific ribonuclease Sa